MESNKSFFWSQGIIIALLALGSSLSLGLMMPINPKASKANSETSIKSDSKITPIETTQRIEQLKSAMLRTWQQEAKAKGLAYSVPQRFQGATIAEAKLSQGQKVIALTFDDGPWIGSTAKVLDILKKNNIKGTFFIVGQMLKEHPDLGVRIVTEGHAIANHTWTHRYHFMNPQVAAYEVDSTSKLIYQTTGVKTTLFRPPGGIMNNGVAAYARNQKYTIVMWSADSVDYSRPPVSRLIHNVTKASKPGGIVLMHDGGGNRSHSVQALPQIIDYFKKQKYSFVTIPELLEMQNKDQKLMTAKK
ncbi:polysaccharide deacetylase family protein [Scytonema hofmannii FACHB-248]|uniref:Polysaccharide deacetylase family protein n=1 Tax=Scytonema hofmannii FACHB-248 TaxID=1842502 RepID=A0ABR8GRL6_9CYAN|nr:MULTISPECIES: polysaccharide deacetylase family protein [Nostocales]MBD2606056.1 polysaccharide deacetylase family protein [Scytonema hofmannii FACHB-248]